MNPTSPRVILCFVFLGTGVFAQYDQCTGDVSSIGDALCEDVKNNAECGFDGGDCCYCSCVDGPDYTCGVGGFNCRDPEYMGAEVSDCDGELTVVAPCSTDTSTQWVVNDTASATALADVIHCSGGAFSVQWVGSVDVSRTIEVTHGTVLHVAGVRPGAEMQAATGIRLFTVINASLELSNIAIAGGSATFGGAIAAAGSYLFLENTSFAGNIASVEGGALYATLGSIASFGEGTCFDGNHAGARGGALSFKGASSGLFHAHTSFSHGTTDGFGGMLSFPSSTASWKGDNILSSDMTNSSKTVPSDIHPETYGFRGVLQPPPSEVSWSGDAVFTNNTADGSGGALYVYSSHLSWSGDAVFSDNTADGSGGALAVYYSDVTWSGDALFSDNTADGSGGSLAVYYSDVTWSGDAVFSDNTADGSGGALYGYYSDLTWSGDASFSSNIAGGSVGALYVTFSHVTWSGDAAFFDNTADGLGGALFVSFSDVSWSGDAVFSDNTADESGGALYVFHSYLSWSGYAVFSDNTADRSGGALVVSSSDVSWSGDAVFSNNTADDSGGALHVFFSNLFWSGDAVFSNNTADDSGGALHVFHSYMSWSGDAVFSANTADGSGGALLVSSSEVFWSGDAMFSNNTADDNGGVLCVYDSNVTWLGDAVFSDNAGWFGGALHVSSSDVTWSGDAAFSSNTAHRNGGAFHITDGSRVDFELGMLLLHNSASGDGGAAFIYSKNDAQPTCLFVNSNTMFHKNSCRGDGGALAVVAAGEVIFTTTNVTFSQNSAGVAGGAVAVKWARIRPRFTGVTFVSNHAQRGGAAYITISGTIITDNQAGIKIQHATTFDRCKFVGNEADATGGAIDTGAGLLQIANTSFASNIARAGGALKLAGVTWLANCNFTENTSDNDEGPAVANSGFVSNITTCSFVDNAFKCEPGEFLDYKETETSNAVLEVVCKGCRECDSCTALHRIPSCLKELEHTRSDGRHATIEALEIDAGYWRATNTSRKILKCFKSNACVGGVTGASNYCSAGYEGPYCSICSDGYYPSLGYVCNKCSGSIGSIVAVAVIVAISAILVVVLLLFCLICGKSTGASRGLLVSWRRSLLSLKTVVIVWQITTQFASLVNVRYPDVYHRFLNFINIVNLDIGRILSMECIIDLDFHHRLFISTLGPAVALTALGAMYAVHGRISRPSSHDDTVAVREEGHQTYVYIVLLLTFLVYSSVSSSLFQMFACDKLDDGKSYLRADYRIDCNSSNHISLQVYAGFMMIVYTAGIPVLYGVLLFRTRHVLMDKTTRQETPAAKSISSLWELYKPHRFYYELIECARRVLLAGVVVFILPNTAAQVGIAFMIATIFMVLSEMVAPYESPWDAWNNRIGHAIVFGTVYLAFLMKVEISNESDKSQHVFGVILVAVQAFLVLLVALEGILVTYQWIKKSR